MKLKIPYIEVEQPIGTFYLSAINAKVLVDIVDIRRRGSDNNCMSLFDRFQMLEEQGVQREQSKERVNKIKKYCSDPDATFPTPIIISVYSNIKYKDEDRAFEFELGEEDKIGDVIDGQHRLLGISSSDYCADFMLPVVLMFNLNTEEKAYVFSIINSTQTKVSMSLIYDLFDLSTKRSPQKVAHEIARAMNKMDGSPFHNRLKMLGKKRQDQFLAVLSQGTFVSKLLTLISKDPDEDSYLLKRGESLTSDYRYPLRDYFIKEEDSVILKILLNCFSALKRAFETEWKNPNTNILWKTTGFGGVIKAFPKMYKRGVSEQNLTEDFFYRCFSNLKEYMASKKEDFSNSYFSGGGEQLQSKLQSYIEISNNL